MTTLPTITAIVGPVASGKTSFSLQLAKKVGGAIISADCRQFYTDLDIGTSKPRAAHKQEAHPFTMYELIDSVPHYFLNIREPNQSYDLAIWQRDAWLIIDYLLSKSIPPIVVGGTTSYIDCLAFNYALTFVPPNLKLRQQLAPQSTLDLYDQLIRQDTLASNFVSQKNRLQIIRALEIIVATGQPFSDQRSPREPKYAVQWHGVFPGWDATEKRLQLEVDSMIKNGLLTETQLLQHRYGPQLPLLHTRTYQQAAAVLAGKLPISELMAAIVRTNMQFAHQQMSHWLNNTAIEWHDPTHTQATHKFHATFNPALAAAMTHRALGSYHGTRSADGSSR